MLKVELRSQLADIEQISEACLRKVLADMPFISVGVRISESVASAGPGGRIILPLQIGSQPWTLVCEAKRDGQPRHVRAAALQLRRFTEALPERNAYGVLLAPFISQDAARILQDEGLGFVDLAGNCRLSFDHVYVERSGVPNPFVRSREQRSLFTPKSTRLLRLLLGNPLRAWRVVELAERTRLSLGQVSNLRNGLIDREWAVADSQGLRVARPGAILDAWRDACSETRQIRQPYYSLLHGLALEAAARQAFAAADHGAHAVFASFSAGNWLAPYARVATNYFYADEVGEAVLKAHINLQPASRGENIVIYRSADDGVLADRIEAAPGLWCTDPIQTYLDLSVAGERGAEAAEHLRALKIEPIWKQLP